MSVSTVRGMGEDPAKVPAVRLRIDLAYDGTLFHGWATQPGLRTVEGEISAALRLVTRVPVPMTVAGRTDAGVHAANQVAHVDFPLPVWERLGARGRDAGEALCARLNGLLQRSYRQVGRGPGCDVVILAVTLVDDTFDARFSALGRLYRYRMCDMTRGRDPLTRHGVTWLGRQLDVSAIEEVTPLFMGEHDFLSFCKPREGATTIRTIKRLEVTRNRGLVVFDVGADAFCHSMVRSIVGSLVEVGLGRRDREWIRSLLDTPSRMHAAPIAAPEGLVLECVYYPVPAEWAFRAAQARHRRDECGS